MINKYFNYHFVITQYKILLNFVQKLSENPISSLSALKWGYVEMSKNVRKIKFRFKGNLFGNYTCK